MQRRKLFQSTPKFIQLCWLHWLQVIENLYSKILTKIAFQWLPPSRFALLPAPCPYQYGIILRYLVVRYYLIRGISYVCSSMTVTVATGFLIKVREDRVYRLLHSCPSECLLTKTWVHETWEFKQHSEYNYQHAFRTCYCIVKKIPAKYHGSCIQNT
jgi:hypothetical protein